MHALARALAPALLAASLLAPPPVRADGWTKISDDDGVVVYVKSLEGVATVSLRGEATIDASVQAIFDVMKDNTTAPEWMPLIVAKRDLAPVSDTERIEYTHIGMPWPIADRYFVNRARAEWLEGGALRLSAESVESDYKEEDKVRGKLHLSVFVLTPEPGGKRTRMTLEVNTDPQGMIPTWIVNRAQRNWPRKFFEGLIGQLEKRGQLNAPIAH